MTWRGDGMMQARLMRCARMVLVVVSLAGATIPAAAAEDQPPMQRLRTLVPPALAGTCERLRPKDMAIGVRGAVAALVCTPPGPIEDVGLYLFDDPDRLEGWWLERLAMIDQQLGPGDCGRGVAGVESRLGGQVACYVDRGVARLRWIDQERSLYGSLDMTRRAIAPAYAWWAENVASCCGPARRPSDPEAGPGLTWRRQDQAPGWPASLEVDLATPSLRAAARSPDGSAVLLGSTHADEPLAWHASDGLDWTEVDLSGLLAGCRGCTPGPSGKVAEPHDVIAWDGGFIAVGDADAEGRHHGVVWTSRDGTSWSRPARLRGASLRQLVAAGETLAVVGVSGRRRLDGRGTPTLWTSSDGDTWTAHAIADRPAWVAAAARSPEGVWLVRGTAAWQSEGDARLWRSTDGITWAELSLPAQDGSGDLLRLVGPVWTPTGFVLGANAIDADGGHAGSQLWHSPDGLTWTVVAGSEGMLGTLASGPGASVALPAVLGPGLGFVEDPATPSVPGVVLSSSDGEAWCRSESQVFAASSVTHAAAGADGEVLAVGEGGRYGGLPRTWWGVPTTPGSVPCTPAITPAQGTTFVLEAVGPGASPGELRTIADLEAAPRRSVTFDRLAEDLDRLLEDPSARAIALERTWTDLVDEASSCRRAGGDERLYSCAGYLDAAVSIHHYSPSERSWRFLRDAYDFILDGLTAERQRAVLRDDVQGYFAYAADEYAQVTSPAQP